MKRCQAEIHDVIGQHSAPSMKDKASLPYVDSTLLEIQRMTSIAPFGVCRIASILSYNKNAFQCPVSAAVAVGEGGASARMHAGIHCLPENRMADKQV